MRLIADNHCILFNLSKIFGSLMGAVLKNSYKTNHIWPVLNLWIYIFSRENLADFGAKLWAKDEFMKIMCGSIFNFFTFLTLSYLIQIFFYFIDIRGSKINELRWMEPKIEKLWIVLKFYDGSINFAMFSHHKNGHKIALNFKLGFKIWKFNVKNFLLHNGSRLISIKYSVASVFIKTKKKYSNKA